MGSLHLQKLEQIFRAVFDAGTGQDVTALCRETALCWDSMAHVLLVTALESEFDIEIGVAESLEIDSFGAAVALIHEKLGAVEQ